MKWDQRYVTEKLRDAVNEKITQMYGRNVPEEPQERLCHEIDSIEKNGWVWHYYFAHLLAGKAKNDGNIVWNRGTAGASFVAYLLGITEVNPLSELYEGFDIPFEVFAGYEGEKKPDFNLNVPPFYHNCLLTFARDTFGTDRVALAGNGNNHLIIQSENAEWDEPIDICIIACELSDDGEFDNDRAKAAIASLKPQSLKDYCRIAALLHGTDTWEGNGKELIENGTCTLQQLICTREDIMNTLLEKGMNRRMAYEIMEHVRKGKANRVDSAKWQEMKVEMRKTGMPKWYIESCEKIKYLFPLGHAVEYVKAREHEKALKMDW